MEEESESKKVIIEAFNRLKINKSEIYVDAINSSDYPFLQSNILLAIKEIREKKSKRPYTDSILDFIAKRTEADIDKKFVKNVINDMLRKGIIS